MTLAWIVRESVAGSRCSEPETVAKYRRAEGDACPHFYGAHRSALSGNS